MLSARPTSPRVARAGNHPAAGRPLACSCVPSHAGAALRAICRGGPRLPAVDRAAIHECRRGPINVFAWVKSGSVRVRAGTCRSVGGQTPRPKCSSGRRCMRLGVASGFTHKLPRGARPTSFCPVDGLPSSSTDASGTDAPTTAARSRGRAPMPSFGQRRCAATPSATSGPQHSLNSMAGGLFALGSAQPERTRGGSPGPSSTGATWVCCGSAPPCREGTALRCDTLMSKLEHQLELRLGCIP